MNITLALKIKQLKSAKLLEYILFIYVINVIYSIVYDYFENKVREKNMAKHWSHLLNQIISEIINTDGSLIPNEHERKSLDRSRNRIHVHLSSTLQIFG